MQHEKYRPGAVEWTALILLALSVAINYIDRGNLSVALSSIETDIHLDQHQLGIISMAFFVSYSTLQLVSAKLIDRFSVLWVYATGYILWSAVTVLTGVVRDVRIGDIGISNFTALFVLRILLGCGESVAYPSYSKIVASAFPESIRGTANAIIDVGTKAGPAAGIMVCVALLHAYGWRAMFVGVGLLSMIWLLPWSFIAPRLKIRMQGSERPAASYFNLMMRRPFWGTVLGLFGGNYAWYFMLTWLPYYFDHVLHTDPRNLGLVTSLPFWSVAAANLLAGPAADILIRRGRSPIRTRQAFVTCGLGTCCLFMVGTILARDTTVSTRLLTIAAFAFGLFSSNHWALTQSLSGPADAGKWTGFQNCLGNLAGVVAPWLTGFLLQTTHSFNWGFGVSCGALVLGMTGYWFVIGRPAQPEPALLPSTPAIVREQAP